MSDMGPWASFKNKQTNNQTLSTDQWAHKGQLCNLSRGPRPTPNQDLYNLQTHILIELEELIVCNQSERSAWPPFSD